MAKTITSNQHRILMQLANGEVPSSLRPERSMAALEKRGLVTRAKGTYRPKAHRWGEWIGDHEIWKLTEAGVETLVAEAHRTHRAAIRKANRDLKKTLHSLGARN